MLMTHPANFPNTPQEGPGVANPEKKSYTLGNHRIVITMHLGGFKKFVCSKRVAGAWTFHGEGSYSSAVLPDAFANQVAFALKHM